MHQPMGWGRSFPQDGRWIRKTYCVCLACPVREGTKVSLPNVKVHGIVGRVRTGGLEGALTYRNATMELASMVDAIQFECLFVHQPPTYEG